MKLQGGINLDKLVIKELTFSAAHYIPNHPKCSVLHGHTYFIRNLIIETDDFVDFSVIKAIIMDWDHCLLVQRNQMENWMDLSDVLRPLGCYIKLQGTDGPPTVENIGNKIKEELLSLVHVKSVSFELYEGPNQGTIIEWSKPISCTRQVNRTAKDEYTPDKDLRQ